MSNHLAIATVTAALGQLIGNAADSAVPGTVVRFGRPTAPNGVAEKKVHLYLYQVTPNAALRNVDTPTRDARGLLKARPQIALDLHYLLSFYGDEQQFEPDRMLGAVVRDLHARPVLQRDAIANTIASHVPTLNGSNLADAIEHVKFTPEPLSLEELSKVWSVFMQTPHALSVVYQGRVVLIESEDNVGPTLPVLERGEGDRGVDTRIGPFPQLLDVHISAVAAAENRPRLPSFPHAELGLHLRFAVRNLGGNVGLRFAHPRLPALEVSIPAEDRGPDEIRFVLPADVTAVTEWAAGIYAVTAFIQGSDPERTSNVLPLPLAPRITDIAPNPALRDASGAVTLSIGCQPQVLPDQSAALLLAGRVVMAEARVAPTDALSFIVTNAPVVTDELVQLRIDGVGSLPFRFNEATMRLEFDDNQRVTIQ